MVYGMDGHRYLWGGGGTYTCLLYTSIPPLWSTSIGEKDVDNLILGIYPAAGAGEAGMPIGGEGCNIGHVAHLAFATVPIDAERIGGAGAAGCGKLLYCIGFNIPMTLSLIHIS